MYFVWHNLYLLLFFSNTTCFDQDDQQQVLSKNLKLKLKNVDFVRRQKWYKI
jgi:hypothetical protein